MHAFIAKLLQDQIIDLKAFCKLKQKINKNALRFKTFSNAYHDHIPLSSVSNKQWPSDWGMLPIG